MKFTRLKKAKNILYMVGNVHATYVYIWNGEKHLLIGNSDNETFGHCGISMLE